MIKPDEVVIKKDNIMKKIRSMLFHNIVTIIFVVLCIIGIILSPLPIGFIASEVVTRITRNSFLVLALIIPVLAGLGLNFGIVVGAMAGQIAIIAVTYWGITGLPGFLLAVVIATPFALLFGYLTGKLLNKTRGQEMIASMIVGFFADGLYQFVFLFLVGTLIPMVSPVMIKPDGIGIRNTIDLSGGVKPEGIKYALDNSLDWLVELPVFILVGIVGLGIGLYAVSKIVKANKNKIKNFNKVKYVSMSGFYFAITLLSLAIMLFSPSLRVIKLPLATALVIAVLCIFNLIIVKTKIGQDFRSVGQDQHIAKVSGINVDKTRVIAIMISIVLAAWGQIIFLQNIGTVNTYGSHKQIGMFSIAALLVGGASVSKATIGQAILGVTLFHTLFIVSPTAGKQLFGDAQIGEYFRSFFVYGVIGVSLGLHAWKKSVQLRNKLKD